MADRFKFAEVRQKVIDIMKMDLLGPSSEEEVLSQNPRFEYLVGMLAPQTNEDDGSNEQEVDGDASFEGDDNYTAGEEDDNEPVSTNRFKTPSSIGISFYPDYTYQGHSFKVTLDILDIEGIFRSKQAGFEKEQITITCTDFGIKGIPCIKAEIETDQYDSYLAIVPGAFLAEIYKKYSSALLEANVRSFLKFNGAVNKGIRGTVLNEKSRFFTYNNGISTTAKAVTVVSDPVYGKLITEFADLQIINGGQTTATLAATNIKNNADLSGIYVQMKLTVLKDSDPELIRNIAKYANSQNKVKTADLNSSHPFYVRMEDFSRRIYAPLASGSLVQQLWFFERARGQYEQPLMQMTKAQANNYKLTRPKNMKFTLTDLAKYMNAANMLPHYVSWGGEVNAAHFHVFHFLC